MSNTTSAVDICPPPFLNQADFPWKGGLLDGRLCAPLNKFIPGDDLSCCLPCPASNFLYPKSFVPGYRISEGLNAISIACGLFLLLTYAVLPVNKSRRHYLSVCLVLSVIVEGLGFLVPLIVRPDQCFDDITPNDMFSSMTCAWSGALTMAGGLGVVVWVFMRAVSIHLQICWDVLPGQKFFYGAQVVGWGIVTVIFTTTIIMTGFSQRFGDSCALNSRNAMAVFWGPVLGLCALSALVQITTTLYCVNVYLTNLWGSARHTKDRTGSSLPSHTSINTHSTKAVYRRVRKVLWLQWRSMLIVVFILTSVTFFCTTFMLTDRTIRSIESGQDYATVMPWIVCLALHGGPAAECSKIGQPIILREGQLFGVLCMLSLAGTQAFVLLVRRSMFVGWREFFRAQFSRSQDFVSVDAKRASSRTSSPTNPLELRRVNSKEPLVHTRSVSPFKPSPHVVEIQSLAAIPHPRSRSLHGHSSPEHLSPRDFGITPAMPQTPPTKHSIASRGGSPPTNPSTASRGGSPDYSREYKIPNASFSTPQTPNQVLRRSKEQEWDPRIAVTGSPRSSAGRPAGSLVSPLLPDPRDDTDFIMMMNRR